MLSQRINSLFGPSKFGKGKSQPSTNTTPLPPLQKEAAPAPAHHKEAHKAPQSNALAHAVCTPSPESSITAGTPRNLLTPSPPVDKNENKNWQATLRRPCGISLQKLVSSGATLRRTSKSSATAKPGATLRRTSVSSPATTKTPSPEALPAWMSLLMPVLGDDDQAQSEGPPMPERQDLQEPGAEGLTPSPSCVPRKNEDRCPRPTLQVTDNTRRASGRSVRTAAPLLTIGEGAALDLDTKSIVDEVDSLSTCSFYDGRECGGETHSSASATVPRLVGEPGKELTRHFTIASKSRISDISCVKTAASTRAKGKSAVGVTRQQASPWSEAICEWGSDVANGSTASSAAAAEHTAPPTPAAADTNAEDMLDIESLAVRTPPPSPVQAARSTTTTHAPPSSPMAALAACLTGSLVKRRPSPSGTADPADNSFRKRYVRRKSQTFTPLALAALRGQEPCKAVVPVAVAALVSLPRAGMLRSLSRNCPRGPLRRKPTRTIMRAQSVGCCANLTEMPIAPPKQARASY